MARRPRSEKGAGAGFRQMDALSEFSSLMRQQESASINNPANVS
jgi:hypothetical protein